MKLKEKLQILEKYLESTRSVGYTTLLKEGTKNYEREKLILVYKKEHYHNLFECKPTEIVSWNNLDELKGHNKPLAIDNAVLWIMLHDTLTYINELEMYKEQMIEIKKIIN